jgi:hypothetical protein
MEFHGFHGGIGSNVDTTNLTFDKQKAWKSMKHKG